MTFEIPKQLQNKLFRFCLLNESEEVTEKGQEIGKRPIEANWQTTANYNFAEIQIAMQKNSKASKIRCGIVCGFGDLIVIDIDRKSPDFEKGIKAMEQLPNTFTVKTANGGRHYYFFCKGIESQKLANGLGEIRAKGNQVLCPNSILRGKNYEFIK